MHTMTDENKKQELLLTAAKYLLEEGFDGLFCNFPHEALVSAAYVGNIDVVKRLTSLGAPVNEGFCQALNEASLEGHLDIVKHLVECGANVHERSERALTSASRRGHLDVVKYLVEQGADIHEGEELPLRVAVANGHLDVVRYCVSKGAVINDPHYSLCGLAAAEGHLEVLKYLVGIGAHQVASAIEGDISSSLDDALTTAAEVGNVLILERLIEEAHSLNYTAIHYEYLIMRAAEKGKLEMVKYLNKKIEE